jgi:hypothetical protein
MIWIPDVQGWMMRNGTTFKWKWFRKFKWIKGRQCQATEWVHEWDGKIGHNRDLVRRDDFMRCSECMRAARGRMSWSEGRKLRDLPTPAVIRGCDFDKSQETAKSSETRTLQDMTHRIAGIHLSFWTMPKDSAINLLQSSPNNWMMKHQISQWCCSVLKRPTSMDWRGMSHKVLLRFREMPC